MKNKLFVFSFLFWPLIAMAQDGVVRLPDANQQAKPGIWGADPSPMSYRAFGERPGVSFTPIVIATEEPPRLDVHELRVEPIRAENFPLVFDPKDRRSFRSEDFTATYLSVKVTYKAQFDHVTSQLFDISAPVFYDDRYLQLNAQDQRLLSDLEGELRAILDEMVKLTDRAERLSKDLAALYARGRPLKLLKDYKPVPAVGEGTATSSPFRQVLPDVALPEQLK